MVWRDSLRCLAGGSPTQARLWLEWVQLLLESVAQCELKRARAARTKESPGGTQRFIELGRRDVVQEARVVGVIETANVGDVRQIEDFGNELKLILLAKFPRLRNPQIK